MSTSRALVPFSAAMASMVHSTNPLVTPTPVSVLPFTKYRDLMLKTPGTLMLKVDGQWVLREHWDCIVHPGAVIEWHELPQGGNASRTVLQIAVVIATLYAWANGIPLPAVGGSGYVTISGAQAITAILTANAVINALIPLKQAEAPGGFAAQSPASVYNASTSGNQARLGQPIPVIYGRHKVFPDYASQPYIEYGMNPDGTNTNDQYFYCLLCVGQGAYGLNEGELFIEGVTT